MAEFRGNLLLRSTRAGSEQKRGLMTRHICVLTPCFNEEENVVELYDRIKKVFADLPGYTYDHLFIDNASTDGTVAKIRELSFADSRVKAIVNIRNFGHIRSPHHGLLSANGDACIIMASDLQDTPELIPEFIRQWEGGYKIVVGVKERTEESWAWKFIRGMYYNVLTAISETVQVEHFTGFGIYDKEVIEVVRRIDDPYPYFRGLISELGYPIATVPFHKPQRKRGFSKNNPYSLYDMAMLGLTSHSKVPLRLAAFAGFILSGLTLLISMVFFVLKLIYWEKFTMGIAPLIIGLFFFSSVQLFFIGLVGEYIGSIYTQVRRRPLVIERERIGFAQSIGHEEAATLRK